MCGFEVFPIMFPLFTLFLFFYIVCDHTLTLGGSQALAHQ